MIHRKVLYLFSSLGLSFIMFSCNNDVSELNKKIGQLENSNDSLRKIVLILHSNNLELEETNFDLSARLEELE